MCILYILQTFVLLSDTILSQIECSKEPGLIKARDIVKRIRKRQLYRQVNTALIPNSRKDQKMNMRLNTKSVFLKYLDA